MKCCFWGTMLAVMGPLVLAGCGASTPGDIGRVSGRVTLDGQPLAGALITFVPTQGGGSTSLGKTDESGQYTLSYGGAIDGAQIGQHRVTITTFSRGNPDAEPPRPAMPEKVPARYNHQTELAADVKAGSNPIDFELQGGGPVIAVPVESAE